LGKTVIRKVRMKTYKKLGIKVRRGPGNWIVNDKTFNGNKGEAVLQYLMSYYTYDGKVWS
jgi:hypothetical protein